MKLCLCRKCRKWWGISSFLTIPKQGYICPECAGDEQEGGLRMHTTEVGRPAKQGEYVKLTAALYFFNRVGDVLKVHAAIGEGGILVLGKDHPHYMPTGKPGFEWYYKQSHYKVLEGYEESKEAVS